MKSYNSSTAHLSEHIESDDRLKDIVVRFYKAYTSNLIENKLIEVSTSVDWYCYECKKTISVDIKSILTGSNFYGTSLFCKEHKPTNYKHLHTFGFVRYENSFYQLIKNNILKTANVLE